MHTHARGLVLAIALVSSGCIAWSARAHVDAVSDMRDHGVQIGVDVGFGYAGKRSALVGNLGVVTAAPTLGISSKIDYVMLPARDERIGWRVGYGGSAALIGEPTVMGARLGALYSLHGSSSSTPGHEKYGFGSSDRFIVAASVGATVGGVYRQDTATMTAHGRLGGSAGVGLELYWLWRLE